MHLLNNKLSRNALAVLAITLGTAATASADHCPTYYYKTVVAHKTITVYETRNVPYTRWVTLYDPYGCPYQARRTYYRTVQVPVQKVVPVTQRVKVYY